MILNKNSVKANIGYCKFMIEVYKDFDNLIIFVKKVVPFTADIVIFA